MQAKFSWLLGSLCFFFFDRSTCDLHWRISKDEDNKLCSLWFFRHDNLLITSQITIKAMFILLSLVYSERAWNSKQQNVLAFYICPDTLLSITLISSLLGVIFFFPIVFLKLFFPFLVRALSLTTAVASLTALLPLCSKAGGLWCKWAYGWIATLRTWTGPSSQRSK